MTTSTIRCAIYTRKSTEEGLEQEFNSLDAQRESSEAYIASQKGNGWVCLPDRYDDGGYTGGNLDRPAARRLLADAEAGKFDCIVVYKVDRLSRSLMDFARIVEMLERNKISFVSITQHFDTTTSMGRLTLNILLSFAQFEREIISERTRDKIAAARRKGKWMGGIPILGYDVDPQGNRRLLAEEILPLAFTGESQSPTIFENDATAELLMARPTGNLTDSLVKQQLQTLIGQLPSTIALLEQTAVDRAAALLDAHTRVREASRVTGKVTVEPVLPVDVLGTFIYLPE